MKRDIEVKAAALTHPDQVEVIDTAENWDEASFLVDEYALVYGPAYRIWSERQTWDSAEGGY